ncbi:putative glycosyltransferase [Vreelandella songnenensis]|uniref:Putative glycosyltransferase n=1 Tax=Vreelandella songnenensis TaxID=1176243 RepID=A0A2T0V2P4_9GAMM|nr:glycosyltransferase [Halomonas songnenensis]PRY64440.1 putative glycosyltransferase [Halomonas songnenensis]
MKKPISFFVHHQGRGHARRTMAIIRQFSPDRPVSVMTADTSLFDGFEREIELIALPDMIGADVPTQALFDQPTPSVMHCVPMGVVEMRQTMRRILDHLDDRDAGLFVIDVSAELALLSRIASVPAVKIRMHGDRNDPGHQGAYEACVGMLAPFDERLEQDDYPAHLRQKTFYTGGLCTTAADMPGQADARRRLGLDPDREVVLVLTGGGGSGTPYAPLTVAARAAPNTLFVTIGPLHLEGHETDFANLINAGWVDNVVDYLAASDIVLASAGDNTVHEIAMLKRPYIVAPEWRYFGEQTRKAERLAELRAAVNMAAWPGDFAGWQAVLEEARGLDVSALSELYSADAAQRAATWLEECVDRLWAGAPVAQRSSEPASEEGAAKRLEAEPARRAVEIQP